MGTSIEQLILHNGDSTCRQIQDEMEESILFYCIWILQATCCHSREFLHQTIFNREARIDARPDQIDFSKPTHWVPTKSLNRSKFRKCLEFQFFTATKSLKV